MRFAEVSRIHSGTFLCVSQRASLCGYPDLIMAARKKKRAAKEEATSSSPLATFKATFYSLVAAAVVVYVAGFFFARTDGFRALLEDQIEKRLGQRIEIASSQGTLTGDLVLEGLVVAGPDAAAKPLAEAKSVRVGVSWKGLFTGGLLAAVREVDLADWHIAFQRDAEGNWQPAGLAMAGAWLGRLGGLDVPETTAHASAVREAQPSGEKAGPASAPDLRRITFDSRDGRMAWWGKDPDEPVARIEGIRFAQTPLALPTRTASHYYLHVDTAQFAGRAGIRDLDVEILMTDDGPYVLDLEAVRQAAPRRKDAVEAWQRYPLSDTGEVKIPDTDFEDPDTLRARIRAELKSALPGE